MIKNKQFDFLSFLKVNLLVFCIFFSGIICAQSSANVLIENELLSVQISPLGAEMQSIYNKKSKTELLWQGDSAYWTSRSPVMFPIVVRIKDDKYVYKGKTYEMPRVGLARINEFKVLSPAKPGTAVFELRSDERTLPYYPFPFRFELTYILEGNKLINQFVIENTGNETMYFGTGGHPGFNCPFTNGLQRGDYQFSFTKKFTLNHHKITNGLVMPQQLPLLINQNVLPLDDPKVPADGTGMMVTNIPSRQIGFGLRNQDPFVTVDLGDFPNTNLWSPPGSPYVCIEALMSHHDFADSPLEIDKKPHLIALPAGEKRTYRFTIIVH